MALHTSPRKLVPLPPTSDDDKPRQRAESIGSSTTKRVFFCGVIVEGSESGKRLPDKIQDVVLSLGDPLGPDPSGLAASPSEPSIYGTDGRPARKRALTDTSALASVIDELVSTEQNYVKRLNALKHQYADPLRDYAHKDSTAIIGHYSANTLFGNIDNLLPVNEAFLHDLEKMQGPHGARLVGGVGDVCLRHFKELKGFEQYKYYYAKREDAQMIFEREVAKKQFADYIERKKYESADAKNRVGLRELLMEPVQRIPRYTMLFRMMIKHMDHDDPQRAKLIEADEIAGQIAMAEADEPTKRAAIFGSLISSIENFPPELFSNSRRYIDCIDVEDSWADAGASSLSVSTSTNSTLHCTLFLFDDKLVIVKRPKNEKGGALSGVDNVDKVTKGAIPDKRRTGMSCKGVVDLTSVVIADVGDAGIHMYLESPPYDQTERWSGRPFRSLAIVIPPSGVNLDPTKTQRCKARFLERLWNAQARYRARAGQSVVLRSEMMEVEAKRGKTVYAKTYYNVYQRTAFMQESKKTKVVVHIDASGTADRVPFGVNNPPFVIIRLQPLDGGLTRYNVMSSDDPAPWEEEIIQTSRISSRIVLTVHQMGLFEFRTGANSRPSTPTARSKVSIFGLDALSRNLFNSRPASAMGDFFGGSINSNRRSRSTNSRSSTYTSTADSSLMRFSHRSNSTAATSEDDEVSFFSGRKTSTRKKLSKRPISPSPEKATTSNLDSSASMTRKRSRSNSQSTETEIEYSDMDDHDETLMEHFKDFDTSDQDLALQLDLARRNSKSHAVDRQRRVPLDMPVEVAILEEEPPASARPSSRASTSRESATTSQHTITDNDVRRARSISRQSSDRPRGPRTPSPLPPIRDNLPSRAPSPLPAPPVTPPKSGIPRSGRLPLFPTGNATESQPTATPIEPLSIKKKSSTRSSVIGSPTPRRPAMRGSPLTRSTPRSREIPVASVSTPSKPSRVHSQHAPSNSSSRIDSLDKAIHIAKTTKEDVDSARRAVKRIKLEVESYRSSFLSEEQSDVSRPASPMKALNVSRPSSPVKGLRTPQATPTSPITKAAEDRLAEMRQLIGKRQSVVGEVTPRKIFPTPPISRSSTSSDAAQPILSMTVDTLIEDAERDLVKTWSNQEELEHLLIKVAGILKERSADAEKTRAELQSVRRQCESVKMLLAENTTEKDIMYEAFNEELDNMYNDVNLPDDEAWTAMTTDLRHTKAERNAISKENSDMKQRIAELELQNEEYKLLLQANGLRP